MRKQRQCCRHGRRLPREVLLLMGISMNARFAVGFFVLIAVATPSQAQKPDERTWRLRTEAGQSVLTYGTDNAEDTPITFSCKAGRGVVDVFISETGHGVKPGRSMSASLAASGVASRVRGRSLPNEEAGVPSFQGSLAASDPLFTALGQAKLLVMKVAPSRQQVPLQKIGDKAEKFKNLCRKR
jgi:hypothetical protein